MTEEPHSRAGDDAIDRAHLDRSQRVWNRWSDYYGKSERDFAPLLDDAAARLGVEHGDAVLEIGSGPGTNFERLREQVGPDGRIVAVDYSPEMVRNARARATERGWENVEVIRADASTVTVAEAAFDAAFASLSTSVLPDPEAAARSVYDGLEPGGRFVVFDLRCVPEGPLRIVNPLLSLLYRWLANWNADADVLDALRATFDDVVVEETYAAGAAYRAVATKSSES